MSSTSGENCATRHGLVAPNAIAAAADLDAVRLAVLAESITSYFDIVDTRHQIALTTKIIDVLSDRVEQTENRYQRGLVTSFELYQVRQDFRNIQASLPQRGKPAGGDRGTASGAGGTLF